MNFMFFSCAFQVQHAVMPVSAAPDEGTTCLDSAVSQGQMYSDVPLQSMQSGVNQYQSGVDMYGQQTGNMSQQMWDQTGAMPRQTMRHPNPHTTMTSPGMKAMVKIAVWFYISLSCLNVRKWRSLRPVFC